MQAPGVAEGCEMGTAGGVVSWVDDYRGKSPAGGEGKPGTKRTAEWATGRTKGGGGDGGEAECQGAKAKDHQSNGNKKGKRKRTSVPRIGHHRPFDRFRSLTEGEENERENSTCLLAKSKEPEAIFRIPAETERSY